MNQCDGCKAGVPVDARGIHWMKGEHDPLGCTAHLYVDPEARLMRVAEAVRGRCAEETDSYSWATQQRIRALDIEAIIRETP